MSEPKTIRSREYRQAANINHREFAPIYEPPNDGGRGWTRDDGVKRVTAGGHLVFWKTYRAKVGTLRDGTDIYVIGDYIGNHRHIIDNVAEPKDRPVGSTWQIWLQTDEDDPKSLECYRLCNLEGLPQFGTLIATQNDFEPSTPELMIYYRNRVPPRPDLGMKLTHATHGEGEVVRLTGTGETWYAAIQYPWPSTHKFPDEGTMVRRGVPGTGGDSGEARRFTYGEVIECPDDTVEVQFDNGQKGSFELAEFYRMFFRMHETSSQVFHRIFNLVPPPRIMEPKLKRLYRDTRTANERMMGVDSRSSVALSAMIARATPDSGEFVRKPIKGPLDHGFRFHRRRPRAPKNDDFAPLTGRDKTRASEPKRGRNWDLILGARKGTAPALQPSTTSPVRQRPPQSGAPVGETLDINGAPALF